MDGSLTARAVRTTCPYCGVGCGVRATPDGRGGAAIEGDTDHPANRGRVPLSVTLSNYFSKFDTNFAETVVKALYNVSRVTSLSLGHRIL